MYEFESKQVLKKALPIKQVVKGSPMFRFYSCESGYILPGHKAEIISGVTVKIPWEYSATVKHCLSNEKAKCILCESYELKNGEKSPLSILIHNQSDEPIQIEYGEVIGTLTLKYK